MYESFDDIFGEIMALYSTVNTANSRKIWDLSSICLKLLQAVEGEGNKYPEVYRLLRKYLYRIHKIVLKEKNRDIKRKALEMLFELDMDLL